MKAAALILLLAAVFLIHGDDLPAAFAFLVALVVLIDLLLPPTCTKACNQGRRGCICRGIP